MTENIVLRGFVATEPRHIVTEEGMSITTFRLITKHRKYNKKRELWENNSQNWYTVLSYRLLASSVAGSIKKGDPILVSGRLKLRQWAGNEKGMTAEVEAEAIGHDLSWGHSAFVRHVASLSQQSHHVVQQ